MIERTRSWRDRLKLVFGKPLFGEVSDAVGDVNRYAAATANHVLMRVLSRGDLELPPMSYEVRCPACGERHTAKLEMKGSSIGPERWRVDWEYHCERADRDVTLPAVGVAKPLEDYG